jgi:metal-sulfur cluster biosynthetic enzyme
MGGILTSLTSHGCPLSRAGTKDDESAVFEVRVISGRSLNIATLDVKWLPVDQVIRGG